MPYAARRPCATPFCGVLVPRGHCPHHQRDREHHRRNYDVRRLYRTKRWQVLREQVLRDQGQRCAACHHLFVELEIDHIVKHGGDQVAFFNRDGVQGLCRSCHQAKTNRGE
jgi:5-methylcytosine-specific restriction protein A